MTTVLTTTTTTTSKRRDPLTTINMATTQARPTPSTGGGTSSAGGSAGTGSKGRGRRANDLDENVNANKLAERKRKPVFDEDVEGFQFSRLPAKKTRSVEPAESAPVPVPASVPAASPTGRKDRKGRPSEAERSTGRKGRPSRSKADRNGFVSPEPAPAPETKITLPMADTPVMQRNKDMRTAAKSEKGSRRSSLGMRGRRASSLIDSGASNEVGTADFYKHISPDLPEPRRMRQLLIWCATRAIGSKPSGSSRSEDHSARLAARVIQEELLKDFESNSELSNWFGREDEAPPAVVVKKPHPKNVQNTEKIRELEEQIQRLQKERQSLNALLRPPSVPRIKPKAKPDTPSSSSTTKSQIDPSHLDPSQQQILSLLQPQSQTQPQPQPQPSAPTSTSTPAPTEPLPPITPAAVSSRLSRLTASLGPTLDTLASGVHDIELYRAMSDRVSAQVLRICAERLDERDARNAAHWLGVEGEGDDTSTTRPREKPREDLGLILGALSRVERR